VTIAELQYCFMQVSAQLKVSRANKSACCRGLTILPDAAASGAEQV